VSYKSYEVEDSCGNVFTDLNVPDAEEHLTKVRLYVTLQKIVKARKLTQVQAAKALGIKRTEVSALQNCKLDEFSVYRLTSLVSALGYNVVIKFRPHFKPGRQAEIAVKAKQLSSRVHGSSRVTTNRVMALADESDLAMSEKLEQKTTATSLEYSKWARKYRPSQGATKILFIAEAPPSNVERYFYFERVPNHDWLWIALMKGLYLADWTKTTTAEQRLIKAQWLKRFKDDGFQLIDAVKEPITGSSRQKVAQIRNNAPSLISEIKRISPEAIVLIKNTVFDGLYGELSKAGFKILNTGPIPFPAYGQQINFRDEFAKLGNTWQ
jgi:predicted XRE-type DNA-binding protein